MWLPRRMNIRLLTVSGWWCVTLLSGGGGMGASTAWWFFSRSPCSDFRVLIEAWSLSEEGGREGRPWVR